MAKLVPYDEEPIQIFGFMAGSLEVREDIINPIDEKWDAENE